MRTAVSLLWIALFLGGCGSPEPGSRPPEVTEAQPPSPTTLEGPGDSVVAAYAAWLEALKAQDAEAACARHDPDFTIALRQEAILLDRAELGDPCPAFVAVLWEDPDREYHPLSVEVTQLTGEDAVLAADFPKVDETVTMARRDGAWFVAATADRVEDGPDRWLDGWCDLALGMSRSEVVDVMGEPSGEYTVTDGGEPQLYWARRQFDFRAYLDGAGRVLDLVGDYDALSAVDRERLSCPELR